MSASSNEASDRSSAEYDDDELHSEDDQEHSEEEQDASQHEGDDQEDDNADGAESEQGDEGDGQPPRRARALAPSATSAVPGILYVSRMPPNMRPHHLRLYLRDMGPLLRVYCAPESEEKTATRSKKGGNKRQQFTEAWVEFARRKDAKKTALLLNGRPMGGKNKRAAFYYDLWNVKYLKGFSWDHLTDDLKKRKRLQEKRLHSQISQAKREAQTYLEQREQARVGDKIIERRAKQQRRDEKRRGVQQQQKPTAASGTPTTVRGADEGARDRPQPRSKQPLDDSFLAQVLGKGKGKEPERRGMKRTRED